ncbi:DinB family protein [Mucilaginibacter sp.]|uniref:DinB family protein n=1 Tax=Mucilaginibacter sp. TaxID=1882438 RepID=UPI002609B386|nr:DinB family protein [Mucilaginibacter sp.]MDB4918766.1 DinB superfamily protein [Mucilaginibacter sp.]
MNEVIQEINNAIYDLFNIDIQSVEWDYKPLPEKWSKKEIVGHLIDSAIINLQRFVRCTFEENFKLIYEQVEWVEAQQYQQADIKELLILWRSLNQQIIRVLENYPANRLQAQCDNSKTSINLHTVEWLAADYADHLKHHLKQIY